MEGGILFDYCILLDSITFGNLKEDKKVFHNLKGFFYKNVAFKDGGDINLFITLVPKVFFLFVGLTALGLLFYFDWFDQ